MKHLKHLFTALLLLCTTMATAQSFEVDGIYYNITDATNKTVAVTPGTTNYTDSVAIPETVTYNGATYSVTSIGYNAFRNCSRLTNVEIPNSVTSIGNNAFEGCSGLKEVHISDLAAWCGISFDSNDANPFCHASNLYLNGDLVTELVIPDGVTEIKNYAFYGCAGLTSIEIPNSVTSIRYEAFYGCSGLTSVVIGNSVTSIGNYAFDGCTGLTSITIPNSVTSIGIYAFQKCTGLTSVVIGNSVVSIGSYAFLNCNGLKTVINYSPSTFVKGAKDYGLVAYYANRVINVTTGSVEDGYVFGELDGVNKLLLHLGNDSILTLPAKYKGVDYAIGAEAFKNNVLITKVIIPNSVTNIENYAFEGCTALKELSIEDCEKILPFGNSVLFGCPLETLYLGRSLLYSTSPFYNMPTIKSVTLPNSVTSIGDDAFAGCTSIEKLDLNCAEIGNWFSGATYLKEVLIGDNVTSIGDNAFKGCSGLEKVCINDLTAWCGIDFGSADANPLYYANNLYLNDELLTELSIPITVPGIKDYAFYNCASLTSVVIPNSVTSIGDDAFAGCTSIEKLDLNCAEIGNWFSGATYLKEVAIGNNVTSIGDNAFKGCSKLANLTISDNVTSIGCGVLDNTEWYDKQANGLLVLDSWLLGYKENEPIGDLVIAEDIKGIANTAFENCTSLSSVEITNNVISIGTAAFAGCTGITNVTVCNGVKRIGSSAFKGCNNMEELYISNSIESIGNEAFAECENIFEIKIGSKKAIAANENIFSSNVYINACLYVPNGRKFAYERATPWNNFYIVEMDFTSIDEVYDEVKSEGGKGKTVYDLNGRAVENPTSGVYIINGKKVIIK